MPLVGLRLFLFLFLFPFALSYPDLLAYRLFLFGLLVYMNPSVVGENWKRDNLIFGSEAASIELWANGLTAVEAFCGLPFLLVDIQR